MLQQQFGIPGLAEIVPGNGGLAKVRVTLPAAFAEIYLHGAQVTSWQPAGAQEVLFLSNVSRWEKGKAIRGGIPVCFPWFRGKADNPTAPAHGVVRTQAWKLTSLTNAQDTATVTLATESDEATRQWWPHEFRLVHRITIGKTLTLELTATNTGSTPMRYEEAQHTYYKVADVRTIQVAGLDGVSYLDNTDGNVQKKQLGDVAFTKATDNAYTDTRAALTLIDPGIGRQLQIEKQNSLTTVVWNPWEEGAKALADLGDDEWLQMACVEASNILDAAVTLQPGASHTLQSIICVLS